MIASWSLAMAIDPGKPFSPSSLTEAASFSRRCSIHGTASTKSSSCNPKSTSSFFISCFYIGHLLPSLIFERNALSDARNNIFFVFFFYKEKTIGFCFNCNIINLEAYCTNLGTQTGNGKHIVGKLI